MSPESESEKHVPAGAAQFDTTHWSVVLAAGHRSSPDSNNALETLCRTYWYPLYTYVRRRVADVHEAQDLTQEFFARLLEGSYAQAARELGMTEGAARVAAHRLRRRYRQLLRAEIAQTVAEPEEIEDEIRSLFAILGS